ncbi:CHAT domain-containing tetratricopeptide repeat protein [Nocardia sp. NPDC050793]|uniref:CHAT domain-containing protein n=1 Tax=Nocardia sp. NPDC050793 TaxID=3155159 RepID=UPI0033D1976F
MTERDVLAETIRRRIDYGPEGATGYLDAGTVVDGLRYAEILRSEGGTTEEWGLLGTLHWQRFQHPDGGLQHDLVNAIWAFAPCFVWGAVDLPEQLLHILADQVEGEALAFLESVIMSAADSSEFAEAVELWERILSATPIDHPNRAARLNSMGGLMLTRSEQTESEEDFLRAHKLFEEAISTLPPDDPQRAFIRNNLGVALHDKFERTGSPADLELAIESLREAETVLALDDPFRARVVPNLVDALDARFLLLGDQRDLDAAIEFRRELIDRTDPGDPDRYRQLGNLGASLNRRSIISGSSADLDEAIDLLSTVMANSTPDPRAASRSALLNDLGAALATRARRIDAPRDLDRAIALFEEAAASADFGQPQTLCNIGEARIDRFLNRGEIDDIDTAVRAFQDAFALNPDPLWHASIGLSIALWHRYERLGAIDDLNASIDLLDARLDSLPGDNSPPVEELANLGTILTARFEHLGTVPDLDRAIRIDRQAETLARVGHPARPNVLNGLGIALRVRHRRLAVRSDLDEAIRYLIEAVSLGTGFLKGQILHNLATAHVSRFKVTGEIADLDDSIRGYREALRSVADRDRPGILSSLGQGLGDRFEHLGNPEDLDAALAASAAAVAEVPEDHPERSRFLNHLGNLFEIRFERLRDLADADAAVLRHREAVATTPDDHFERAGYLLSLGNVLLKRYQVAHNGTDLDAAVRTAREAVDLVPEDSAERAAVLNLLCSTLTERFQELHDRKDIDEAVTAAGDAVDCTPLGHYNLTAELNTYATALHARFQQFGNPDDAAAAMTALERAVAEPSAAASLRIQVAHTGAGLLAAHEPARAAELLATAVSLLTDVAPRRLKRAHQQQRMEEFTFVASDAAALLLADTSRPADERAIRALETLEAGRGVLLSQTLETRSDITELRAAHPPLAARFEDMRDALDTPADPTAPAEYRESLASQFGLLLNQIRGLPHFGSFGLPPTAGQLIREADHGSVVTINVSRYRSDAILLTGHGIHSLELPALTMEAVFEQVRAFHAALADSLEAEFSIAVRRAAEARLHEVLAWLWDVAAEPIMNALDLTSAGEPLPRLWWALSGLLGLLPMHAAGRHGECDNRTVLDRVVSSYIPTIRALGYARRMSKPDTHFDQSLIVAMPSTPGTLDGDLPSALDEAAKIEQLLPLPITLFESNESADHQDKTPTVSTVLRHLTDSAYTHFICHGFSSPGDPSQSGLLLHDHQEQLLTVGSLAGTTLAKARLAYLSACDTALNSNLKLLDESIHLAGAFQLAGFPHVIGAFWAISDEYSAAVAESFYRALSTGEAGRLNAEHAARALHRVVRTARDRSPMAASRWAAYLHTGA